MHLRQVFSNSTDVHCPWENHMRHQFLVGRKNKAIDHNINIRHCFYHHYIFHYCTSCRFCFCGFYLFFTNTFKILIDNLFSIPFVNVDIPKHKPVIEEYCYGQAIFSKLWTAETDLCYGMQLYFKCFLFTAQY